MHDWRNFAALADVLDDLDELVQPVTLAAGKVDELFRPRDDGSTLGRAGNRNPSTSSELEQPVIAQDPKRPQHGVRIDAEDRGKVLRRRQSLAAFRLALGDRATNLSGDLLIEIGGIGLVYLDIQHGAIHSSAIVSGVQA